MTQSETAHHWFDAAKRNSVAAKDLFMDGHYDWSLFLWHLVLEKTLKGFIVRKGNIPTPIHNLVKLAKVAGIPVDKEKERQLKEITSYNIEARYDDYKKSFYQKATKEYATVWANTCEALYLWLMRQA